MKKYLLPVSASIIFLATQAIIGAVILAIYAMGDSNFIHAMEQQDQAAATKAAEASVPPEALAIAIIVSGIVGVAIISLMKLIRWNKALSTASIPWKTGIIGIVASIVGIFGLDIMTELAALPNSLEDQFIGIASSFIGIVGIAVAGPIIEELVFREAILGGMLRRGVGTWTAIIISSLIFGIVHLNLAQIPFAALMGMALGILYVKSGNIVLPALLHITNNSIAAWQMAAMGAEAKNYSLVNELGGTTSACIIMTTTITIGFIILRRSQRPIVWKGESGEINVRD